ncbi:MAG: amylo-alpha-1,6-glucosidase, partial [Methanococcaceae archaeon]
DVSEQILYSFYLYDAKTYLLAKKGFRELLNTQKKDGSLFSTAPGVHFHLPDQNLAAINSIGDYFMYTADTALIRELYPKISNYVKQYISSTFNNDSMLVLQKVWNWIDWGDSLDVQTGSTNTVVNGLFIRLTGTLKTLAAAVGAREDILYYQKLQTAVKKNFNSYFWNEKQNAYAFHRLHDSLSVVCDDRSNAWAVLAGVVDSTRSAGVLNILRHKLWASPYQERYIEEAMFVLNSPELALKRMLDYYQPDIDSWSQTMWERMGNNSTNNHAWAASPCYLLGAYVAGIKPLKPGFAEYQIMPVLGGLTAIAASVPTVKGMISSVDSLFSNRFTMKVNSPEGTVTILGIPKTRHWRSVTVNGIIIWNDGKYSPNSESILDAGSDEKYIKFKVKPGEWNFTASIL